MKKGKEHKTRRIPEALGNRACGVWMYVAVLILNLAAHAALFISYGLSLESFIRLVFSFIFFIYPLCYAADVLWSLLPSVRRILSGEIAVNRKYYMNAVQKEVSRDALLPVTVSIPVYMESNDVIFKTIRDSMSALRRYREFSGAKTNIVVSDDGLAPLLGGSCSMEKAERIVSALRSGGAELTEKEKKAAERILFYRENGIGFVVRPAANRAGLFKKASNLNYTLRLGKAVSSCVSPESLFLPDGAFAGGYAEGMYLTYEVILLLDKDSGIKDRIIEAILPEFAVDDKLAYVQCATNADNLHENYYSSATGQQTNTLFHNIWPCKALQGFFVPLVGHNVFMRRSMLEKTGLWAENRVSEDYDMAIRFYGAGYHGKYAHLRGLEFSESSSRTFTEETNKQRRYAYGLFEMVLDGTISRKKARGVDIFYMLLYFCSAINQAFLIPTVLYENFFGSIHLLWAGFLLCMTCFVLFPLFRTLVTRRLIPEEHEGIISSLIISLSFLGHSYSIFVGACRFFANKLRKITTPFPSTNVDQLDYRFKDGAKILFQFFRKNVLFLVIAFLCLDRGVYLLTRRGIEPVTVITYAYILFGTVLVPILLTPQIFGRLASNPAAGSQTQGGHLLRRREKTPSTLRAMRSESLLTPTVIEPVSSGPDAVEEFLSSYRETLMASLPEGGIPEALLTDYTFEGCLKDDPNGKKSLYLMRRNADGAKALLRITAGSPEEDALEEAMLLQKLDHPGIPKVYGYYEKDDRRYLVREYIEGRTLEDIVSTGGTLSAGDIFQIAGKLTDILCYLHAQKPPVIHRDIKPQNIIVGRDGNIYLIDFGIARVYKQQRSRDTTVILTLDYASPEQYGFEQTSPLSDIYSMGVVLLYLATGRTIRSDLEAQIVNNRLRYLIEQCIAFNPKMRIQSAEEIRRYINRSEKYHARKRKRKRSPAAAAALLAAAVALSALAYWRGFVTARKSSETRSYDRGYDAGYSDGYDSAPVFLRGVSAPSSEVGTDSVNMAVPEGAFAAVGGGMTFYVEDGAVWRMSADEANPVPEVEEEDIGAISCLNDWLYYSAGSQILQKNLWTPEIDVLCKTQAGKLYVTQDAFYILADDGVYLLDLETGKPSAVTGFADAENLTVIGDTVYYIDGSDRSLYRSDLSGTERKKLGQGPYKSFCLFDGDLFCAAGGQSSGTLVRIDGDTGETTTILEAQIKMLYATEEGIYYLDRAEETIFRSAFDGRIRKKVVGNRVEDFNMAGGWIFYHNKDDGGRLWCVRLDGANDHPVQSGR